MNRVIVFIIAFTAFNSVAQIASNRPGMSFSSTSLDKSIVQLESGVDINVDSSKTLNFSNLVRYGLDGQFEFFLSADHQTIRNKNLNGFVDINLGYVIQLIDLNQVKTSFRHSYHIPLAHGKVDNSLAYSNQLLFSSSFNLNQRISIFMNNGVQIFGLPKANVAFVNNIGGDFRIKKAFHWRIECFTRAFNEKRYGFNTALFYPLNKYFALDAMYARIYSIQKSNNFAIGFTYKINPKP